MTMNLRTDLALDDVHGSSDMVRHTRSDDLEEHTRQLLDWNLEYDQLDGGQFEGKRPVFPH